MGTVFIVGNNGQWGQSTRIAPMFLHNQQCRGIFPERKDKGRDRENEKRRAEVEGRGREFPNISGRAG
jgi:hypothetical protein